MKLTQMRPQPENSNSLSSANFFNWKEAGSQGIPIRAFGDFVRRYLHFVTVTKADGTQVKRPISCINFDTICLNFFASLQLIYIRVYK